jgi:activator of HSP90 ATPase
MGTIKQNEIFANTTANTLYAMLMDSAIHAAFTGDEATISTEVGGSYSAYGGYSTGKNLELIPGKRIVQTWHAADWAPGAESICIFEFEQQGNDAVINFTHEDVPEEQLDDIAKGWIDFYWEPMRAYLAEREVRSEESKPSF